MNPIRRLGSWLVRTLIEEGRADHPARPGHIDPAQIESAVHANRDMCHDRYDDAEIGSYWCTLAPDHAGDHECHSAMSGRTVRAWRDVTAAAHQEAQLRSWLQTVGATDPDTPIYHDALAAWAKAKEYLAERQAFREAPAMVAEVEVFLQEADR
ncbi:hypothetical protein [Isoptericola sp. NPDC055881]